MIKAKVISRKICDSFNLLQGFFILLIFVAKRNVIDECRKKFGQKKKFVIPKNPPSPRTRPLLSNKQVKNDTPTTSDVTTATSKTSDSKSLTTYQAHYKAEKDSTNAVVVIEPQP